ncbi:MAG TPA: hypothetical protein GXZ65_00830 [Clostridiales bacterium]|jgi:hypothetical protein|nr:hypothetical protein [Clostridiales bacterium]
MRITKGAVAESNVALNEKELEEINKFARSPLKEEDIYCFAVLLCDNEVDRDFERFTVPALMKLSELFVGKTGIFDHNWSAGGQKARIYRTELVTDRHRKTLLGEPYAYLKAYAYMLRTESNAELIAEIEGGIKKEVSLGCSVARSLCSICGEAAGKCSHERGKKYGGKLCYFELHEPTDAYEWSFVAVPAQKNAGVIKRYDKGFSDLHEFLLKSGGEGFIPELETLKRQSELGKRYLEGLRSEVVKLGLLFDEKFDAQALKSAAEKMDERELTAFKAAFGASVSEKLPLVCQIPGAKKAKKEDFGSEFMI